MSYRLKLTITISLLIAISFGIGGTLMTTTSFNRTLEQETQSALSAFENIQNTLYLLNSLGDQTDFQSLADALKQMETQKLGQWQALSLKAGDDQLFLSGSGEMLSQHIPSPAENQCTLLPVSDNYGHGLLVKSIIFAGTTELEVLARFDLSHVYSLRDTQQRQYLIIYSAVIVFGIVSSVVLSFVLTRHLHRLTVTVRKITGGDLSRRSQIGSHDEFGQLSRDFDAMADNLQENISKLESDMQRQESFMGAFAHELKTPMTSIIGFADLLRQGNMDENTRIMAADYIYSEGKRLERLSFKLLDLLLLKKDTVSMKRVWLNTYLAEVERALAPNMKAKNIRLVCKADSKRVAFEADLVKSLLYNLVDNASKAMDTGGIIAIVGTAIPGGCQFQVVDNGRGMEQEELTKITEAFYRVDKARSRSQGGAGLGLALCRQIAELHNGSIQFASVPEKGTRVTVTLYGKVGHTDE
ncbi:MAG: HAMP domain-containing histidine kinase [Oscillospiraceae bacterium]|nr:HAMP domain-containing histidine kinase [Oscillospiraceae bacterium]